MYRLQLLFQLQKGHSKEVYIGSPYFLAEMYAGCVARCPLVSCGEFADETDRQTDGRETVTLRSQLNAA